MTVEVRSGKRLATVTLRESVPGAHDWAVEAIDVRAGDGQRLSASGLRDFPWASVLRQARRKASGAARDTSPFGRLSDPPQVFRKPRRGGQVPRATHADFAHLAFAYANVPADQRREIAGEWARRYGRTAQSWRKDIARAKEFVEEYVTGQLDRNDDPVIGLGLTEAGMELFYGPDIWDRLDFEHIISQAEDRVEALSGRGNAALRAALMVKIGRKARENRVPEQQVLMNTLRSETRALDEYRSRPDPGQDGAT